MDAAIQHIRDATRRALRRVATWPFWGHWSVPVAVGAFAVWAGGLWAGALAALTAYALGEAAQLWRLLEWLRSPEADPPPLRGIGGRLARRAGEAWRRIRNRLDTRGFFLKNMGSLVNHLPSALVTMDPQLRVAWANKTARSLLGVRWPEDDGVPITHLLRHPAIADAFRRLGDSGESPRLSFTHGEGVTLDARLIRRSDGRVALLARDISQSLRQRRAQRDFVTNASHELRTPLTVLSGMTELLAADAKAAPADWRPKLEIMVNQTRYMCRLTDDLLKLSRLENEPLDKEAEETLDMNALCRQVAEDLSGWANRRRLSLRVEDGGSQSVLRGHRSDIHRVLVNLISNAIQHSRPDGRVTVRWLDDPAGARLEVADDGVGVAARHIPRLTERFYRVEDGGRAENGGTGLGLAIVRHVLDRHQATLRVESVPAEGSVFSCLFPYRRLSGVSPASRGAGRTPRRNKEDGAHSPSPP